MNLKLWLTNILWSLPEFIGKHRHYRIFLPLLLALVVVGTVYAAATFDMSSVTGPAWLNPGYQWTVDVLAMSNPHHNVNMSYSVSGGTSLCSNCTCTSPACNESTGVGQWVCTIPTNYTSATIAWDMSAYPDVSCAAGNKIQGPTGSFSTGPTSVVLNSFTSKSASGSILSTGSVLVFSIAAVLIVLLFANRNRVRKNI